MIQQITYILLVLPSGGVVCAWQKWKAQIMEHVSVARNVQPGEFLPAKIQ